MNRRAAATPQACDLGAQLGALGQAAALCRGRIDEKAVMRAEAVVARAGARLSFSGERSVVALAGATGSGKSSLLNALATARLAEAGVKRPTTSRTLAVSFGAGGDDRLLDWLEVPVRTSVHGMPELDGLVLLDLPDHDSIQLGHRLEADRLVSLVDALVWVVDPQKYADAALHRRYLVPMAGYAEMMIVVLNQADRLAGTELSRTLADLRRLLDAEGLGATTVLATSTLTGQGVDALRARLAHVVAGKQAAARRSAADIREAAQILAGELGDGVSPGVDPALAAALEDTFARAAGIDMVGQAVLEATRRRGAAATGWPLVSWISAVRADPLKRLHLDLPRAVRGRRPRPEEIAPTTVPRTSITALSGGVERARIDSAVRALSDRASMGLAPRWAEAVRAASLSTAGSLADDLDRAVGSADLGMASGRGWWRLVRIAQWTLLTVLALGCGWLAVNALFSGTLPIPRWHGAPVPTVLVLGGAGAGILLGVLSRAGVELSARRRRARALGALREAVARVARVHVIAPVAEELERHEQARTLLAAARGQR
ncbi:GTP-binding protein EngB required for normal cell division [Propionibacterium cyclohexanicum]|uniref:GTP-binding protein EngB required for normal cell division n=1 Tax=Propionibacterium cyclohexanicum TaxID=64702 RepID=A0A1H9TM73_9ACTN|nr:GTPase [Propionibacterium cyclohexanicum]SER98221.1 GTP-binding protein EngB required for normal cell division [Propionibacterium cyclohexanicum]